MKINLNLHRYFILGMPNQNKQHLEQVISSHSKVHGAGELKTIYLKLLINLKLTSQITLKILLKN